MIQKRHFTKLGFIVVCLHIIVALLVVICLGLMVFGGNEQTAFEGRAISTWRFFEPILLSFMIGWFLSIPIVIFDVLYAAKHLLPGDRRRVPVIMSAAFFGFFAVFFGFILVGLILSYTGSLF